MTIKILQGNIVNANVDAIVNAANPMMLGGGTIHQASGLELLLECGKVKAVNV